MKITNKTISDLSNKYPNNSELGEVIRKISWKLQEDNVNDAYVDPNQITIDDVINEVQQNKTDGTTRL